MIKISREKFLSAPGIFIIYIFASWIVVQGFFLIFPGEPAPLVFYSTRWRFLRGLAGFFGLFPALALSALVIPFGVTINPAEKLSPFSPKFLQSLRASIFTAIAAAAIYAALAVLALPASREYEDLLRSRGRLYNIAREEAQNYAALGEWSEAAAFIDTCERIWPLSPELEKLRTETDIRLSAERLAVDEPAEESPPAASWPNLPDEKPPNAAEALAMAETAMSEERYFDAHWLASLGGRLAGPGSAETAASAMLASRAWNAINSLEPNSRENEAFRVYHLKRDGYEALMNEDWIRAYYIFLELKTLSPADPDVEKYFSISEQGCGLVAFFLDEMELTMGNVITNSVFSLPMGLGRAVMRLSSLVAFPDSAYGTGLEILAFDRDGRPAWRIKAPYVKMLPLALEPESGGRVSLLLRALDRDNENIRWEALTEGLGENAPDGVQLTLNIGWDEFLLLSTLRRGAENLPAARLLAAAKIAGNYGYLPQVFEAEVLCRFAHPVLFLASAIAALAAGWRYRAQKKPRYLFAPMLFVLPVVFNGLVQLGRMWTNYAGIWAVITFGFSAAIAIFAGAAVLFFVGALILLSAQHS